MTVSWLEHALNLQGFMLDLGEPDLNVISIMPMFVKKENERLWLIKARSWALHQQQHAERSEIYM